MTRRARNRRECDAACEDRRDRRQSRARAWLTWLVGMVMRNRRGRA